MDKDIRTLEYDIESKLSIYSSQLASNNYNSHLGQELKQLLDQLSSLNTRLVQQQPDNKHTRQHQSNLLEFLKEFNKIRTQMSAGKEREELLDSIHEDIRTQNEAQERLLHEQGRIENSHSLADDIFRHASIVREDLESQGSILGRGRSRMTRVLERFPQLNHLMRQIKARKNRDTIILGSIIGLGFCFFIWYFLM